MIFYICIELFEERTLVDIRKRQVDPKLADNIGDGIVEYAAQVDLLSPGDAITISRDADRLLHPFSVKVDDGIILWYCRRVQICEANKLKYDRVVIAHAQLQLEMLVKCSSIELDITDQILFCMRNHTN